MKVVKKECRENARKWRWEVKVKGRGKGKFIKDILKEEKTKGTKTRQETDEIV